MKDLSNLKMLLCDCINIITKDSKLDDKIFRIFCNSIKYIPEIENLYLYGML